MTDLTEDFVPGLRYIGKSLSYHTGSGGYFTIYTIVRRHNYPGRPF